MPKKMKIAVLTILSLILLALSFGGGYALGDRGRSSSARSLDIIEQAWNIIFRDYVNRDNIDANTLSQGAIEGMVEALDDPYTAYIDAETYQLGLASFEGKFEGIGAQVTIRDQQLMIIAPIPDAPAAKAGIKAGDIILEINGIAAPEMSLTEAVLGIRGPKGTSVTLLILHQDDTHPEDVEIVRAEIEMPSINFEMKGDIAYIQITHFSERTEKELSPALESAAKEAATGIILDLRSNAGGILRAVIDVASHFLKEGIIIDVVDNQGNHTTSEVETDAVTTDLPLIILVDSFSASGSEVLSGALQDHGRATIAGTRTFGKGSVNMLHHLEDGSGLYITTARWFTPNGRLIEGKGIYPDHELTEDEDIIQWAIDHLKSSPQ